MNNYNYYHLEATIIQETTRGKAKYSKVFFLPKCSDINPAGTAPHRAPRHNKAAAHDASTSVI